MARKTRFVQGRKFHVSPDGIVRECKAEVRLCRFGQHYDTEKDAVLSTYRYSTGPGNGYACEFREVLSTRNYFGDALIEKTPRGSYGPKTFRGMANKAVDERARTGRSTIPIGDFTIELSAEQTINLRRETYDDPTIPSGLGVRYHLFLEDSENGWSSFYIPLNTKTDCRLLVRRLNEMFVDAAEYSLVHETNENFEALESMTWQKLSEIEVLARGSEAAHRELGLDVFSNEVGTIYELEIEYDSSVVTPQMLTESIRHYAAVDRYPHEFRIKIDQDFDEGRSAWSLIRERSGEWWMTVDTPEGVRTSRLHDPDQITKLLDEFVYPELKQSRDRSEWNSFCRSVFTTVESDVKNYSSVVEKRWAEREERKARRNVEKLRQTG